MSETVKKANAFSAKEKKCYQNQYSNPAHYLMLLFKPEPRYYGLCCVEEKECVGEKSWPLSSGEKKM